MEIEKPMTHVESNSWLKQSPEGIAWGDYHALELMLAAVPGALLRGVYEAYKGTIAEETSSLRDVPSNAIIFAFHTDIFKTFSAQSLVNLSGSCHFLGYHGLLSYLTNFPFFNRRYQAIRFSRRHHQSPFQQIISRLETVQNRFFMYTDAGGPYGQVRESLIELSIQTQRPLVGVRHVCNEEWTVAGHGIPRPGAKMRTFMSPIFHPKDLAKFSSRSEARQLVQTAMDGLVAPFNREQKPHKAPAVPSHNHLASRQR